MLKKLKEDVENVKKTMYDKMEISIEKTQKETREKFKS